MVTREDIEGFLARLEPEGTHAKEINKGLWVLTGGAEGPEVVVHYNPPVLVLRVKVLELGPSNAKEDLYKHLLRLNATDLIHGSYGLDGSNVVLTDALELENLDFTEFQASYDSLVLALASHLATLAPYRQS